MNTRKLKQVLVFAGTVAVVPLLRGFAFTSCLIPSTDMENSLFQGERILVSKWGYGLQLLLMSLSSYRCWCERSIWRQDVVVSSSPATIGQPTINRREVYISRYTGAPGDTLLVGSLLSMSSPETQLDPGKKKPYVYPAAKEWLIISFMQTFSIASDGLMGSNGNTHVRSLSHYEYYLLEQVTSGQSWIQPLTEKSEKGLKPLTAPGKGKALRVYPWNITLLRNTLAVHEGRQMEIKSDTPYIDGEPTQHRLLTRDYYWIAPNNSVNLSDSRLFEFVPQDHITGKASLI